MSWKKSGGIDYSRYSNNITSNQSNFNKLETLQINSNNTFLHVASNTLRLGNNTGNYEQINALWFGGLDDNDYINCYLKGWCAKITEGKTKLEIANNTSQTDKGFIISDDENFDTNKYEENQIPFQ